MSHWRALAFLPILCVGVCVLGGCDGLSEAPPSTGAGGFRPPRYALEVDGHPLEVELAVTDEEQSLGLMCREKLDETHGMLFVYDDEARRSFWMKDTFIPLSIAFIDRNRVVRDIRELKPRDKNTVWSQGAAMYALEVNRGWFSNHGIAPGAKVTFSPELEARIEESR